MRHALRFGVACAMLCMGQTLSAQVIPGMPSPEEMEEMGETMAQMMENAKVMMNPPAHALANAEALELTPDQISRLEPLADELAAVIEEAISNQSAPPRWTKIMSDPEAEIDEEAIRAEACENAVRQVGMTIALARGSRELQGILTEEQAMSLMQLQLEASRLMLPDMSGMRK